jgi:hypothetical protein
LFNRQTEFFFINKYMDFKTFFSTSTPHTREHQQTPIRSFNRKRLNQVPYSKNPQKAHPYITTLLKNKISKNEKISELLAADIAKVYGLNFEKEENKDFVKNINRTGASIKRKGDSYYITYNPDK